MGYTKKEIVIIVLGSLMALPVLAYISYDRVIGFFLMEHENGFLAFLCSFSLLLLITGILYQRTLDFVDEATPLTNKVTIINIMLWCIFWICWCVYNVTVLIKNPVNIKLFVFSFLLTTLPGVAFFMYALWSRKEDREARRDLDYEESALEKNVNDTLLQIRFYIGFYGIFTIPVYLIAFAIAYLIT